MKKTYNMPQLNTESLLELDIMTASGNLSKDDAAYFNENGFVKFNDALNF